MNESGQNADIFKLSVLCKISERHESCRMLILSVIHKSGQYSDKSGQTVSSFVG